MDVDLLLDRLKREFLKVNVLQASLDTIIAFLAVNLVFFTFSIRITPQLSNHAALTIAATIFFFADLYHRKKQYRIELYEEKNPEFREILRTARDNRGRDDEASWALFFDLLERARNVPSDRIMPSKIIIQKILLVGGLSLFTILSGVTDFHVLAEGGQLLPAIPLGRQDAENDTVTLRDANEIYGDPEEIQVADLDIGVNITGTGETRRGDIGPYADPDDIQPLTLDRSGEAVLTADLDLAQQYSLALKNITEK